MDWIALRRRAAGAQSWRHFGALGTPRSAALASLVSLVLLAPLPAAASPSAPVIAHEPLSSFAKGEALTFKAKIRSPIGKAIFSPAVFLCFPGVEAPLRIPLALVAGEANTFAAQVPPNLTQADFEYFIEAFDEEGNGPSRLGSPEAPIRARAVAASWSSPPAPRPLAAPVERDQALELGAEAGRPWQRTAGAVGLTAGGVLLAGALGSGAVALVAKKDATRAAAKSAYDAALARARSSARVANGLAAAGAVAGCAGAAFLIFAPKESGKVPALGFGAGPQGAGLLVQGSF